MGVFRHAVVGVATVAIAGLAAGSAISTALDSRAPTLAARTSPFNGFALSRLVSVQLAMVSGDTSVGEIEIEGEASDRIASLARQALRREPLDFASLRNLGIVTSGKSRDLAKVLMEKSRDLTRRDLATQSWFIEYYTRNGDEKLALQSLDRAMRTSLQGRANFIDQLLTASVSDEVGDALIELLDKDAGEWEQQFWLESYRHPNSALQLARVRMARANAGVKLDPRVDQALLDNLLRQGHFDSARRLQETVERWPPPRGQRVRNWDFEQAPGLRPFGWHLEFDSLVLPNLVPSRSALAVDLFSDASGLVARQLVYLPEQTYTLTIELTDWDKRVSEGTSIRLDCAEAKYSGAETRAIAIDRQSIDADIRKPFEDCDYYWLSLNVARDAQQPNGTVIFDSIAIHDQNTDGSTRALDPR